MKLLEKILVPVQFDNKTEEHVVLAGKLAQRFNSELLLLHVLPYEAKSDSIKESIARSVKTEFNRIKDNLSGMDLEIREILQYGNTFDQIMNTADFENVNVIIIGNNEPKSNGNFKISILAEKLLRKAEKPVWIHRKGKSTEPDSVLCPVDFSDASKRALNNAIKIARMLDSQLHIVHVLEPMNLQYSPRLKIDYVELEKNRDNESNEQFENFLTEFNFSGIKYEAKRLKGDAFVEIQKY
jgi:nucleotide-binding universal stress UspA family protein